MTAVLVFKKDMLSRIKQNQWRVRASWQSCDAELGNAMSSLQRAAEALKEENVDS